MTHMRPVHFEIHAENPERAGKFYTNVFGWEITKYDMPGIDYWGIVTGKDEENSKYPGVNGGLLKRRGAPPTSGAAVNAFVMTITTPDIDATIAKIMASGGEMALDKSQMPGVGWLAYYKDTEGNIFGILQAE